MKKLFFSSVLVVFSLVLAAYGPMTSISNAESATDNAKIQTMKTKALAELDRRLKAYEDSIKKLDVDVHINKDGTTATTATPAGLATTTTASVLNTAVEVPAALKDKTQKLTQKMVDELKQVKDKVTNVKSLGDMQGLAANINAQAPLDQLVNVQATTTTAIESMTGVLDNLKTTYKGLQSQVTKVKECTKDVATSPSPSPDATAGAGCDTFNLGTANIGTQSQATLDSVLSSLMQTIQSIITSAIALMTTLQSSFSSLLGGLGSAGSLGNLGNVGNMTGGACNLGSGASVLGISVIEIGCDSSGSGGASSLTGGASGGASSLTGGSGSSGSCNLNSGGGITVIDVTCLSGSTSGISGLMSSSSAITSQLDITSLMSTNALGNMNSLTSLINK